ncbi:MAG: hypothetical protein HC838_06585 [Spirulinaceae cyanobacterium RM2_2_10]|nr:hypothetical protein [Spirulinaceae cyanobacterium SM2_1_0]NJO19791.1 hypothetical protein [Spirulinaceae cyanobacterium RM2_2_10]
MNSDREKFCIREEDLAEALGLKGRELDELVSHLEQLPNETTRLEKDLHFRQRGNVSGDLIRDFSEAGAEAIADYLEKRAQVFKLCKRIRVGQVDRQVRQNIYANSSSLVVRNNRHWLSYRDVVKIFRTTHPRLHEAFRTIQRSDNPMKIDEDFSYYEIDRFFSLSGLERLGLELSISLRSETRRDYCERVREVAPPVINHLALKPPSPSQKEIEKVIRAAKSRDGNRCQISGVIRNKYEGRLVEMVGHHLYDKKSYYFLGNELDNIITIAKQVSEDFHQWNGGSRQTCTIDDFIEYVELYYPDKHTLILNLYDKKQRLEIKLSQLQRALPEGEA